MTLPSFLQNIPVSKIDTNVIRNIVALSGLHIEDEKVNVILELVETIKQSDGSLTLGQIISDPNLAGFINQLKDQITPTRTGVQLSPGDKVKCPKCHRISTIGEVAPILFIKE